MARPVKTPKMTVEVIAATGRLITSGDLPADRFAAPLTVLPARSSVHLVAGSHTLCRRDVPGPDQLVTADLATLAVDVAARTTAVCSTCAKSLRSSGVVPPVVEAWMHAAHLADRARTTATTDTPQRTASYAGALADARSAGTPTGTEPATPTRMLADAGEPTEDMKAFLAAEIDRCIDIVVDAAAPPLRIAAAFLVERDLRTLTIGGGRPDHDPLTALVADVTMQTWAANWGAGVTGEELAVAIADRLSLNFSVATLRELADAAPPMTAPAGDPYRWLLDELAARVRLISDGLDAAAERYLADDGERFLLFESSAAATPFVPVKYPDLVTAAVLRDGTLWTTTVGDVRYTMVRVTGLAGEYLDALGHGAYGRAFTVSDPATPSVAEAYAAIGGGSVFSEREACWGAAIAASS